MSRYSYRKNGFDFGDFEITKREILASISIVAVMLLIGVLISSKISEHQLDANEVYNKAVKIDNTDLFQYGMDTNVGNAFVYGDLVAVDTVTYPEIGGEYIYVEKVKEKYTRHTKRVKSGKHYRTKVYWTWDRVGSEDKKCQEISFCGITFGSNKIDLPNTNYIDTIKESSHIRYKYYGIGTKYTGTIFTDLRNQTISDNTKFYIDKNINETVEYLEAGGGLIIFWIFWIVLIGGCVFGFYYLDNKWLE
ncbi:hypothetical protein [Roseburia sp. 1XD42-69]|uniref:hypothetical protein n=1 Tax=Roseburia sp. 1XD42-69 TaxID=2320088 RepID=UPI000EA128C1|nr:hypothetical protein [Roseburia sp. 1XD42-69]RKJ68748.1 hypothetical protein D7Y06_00395 [Roseburia sp. 1XD42-69]